ncbi:NACHT, LRR and PYD domains-containing protein 12-like [Mixophyes fleayi]|uniref:NACHT, LRR and PYD domains-containing protein 12-like n=1 Tax=Mixophyes fleayi TaxID=3061075 RepID=UPI003F4E019B
MSSMGHSEEVVRVLPLFRVPVDEVISRGEKVIQLVIIGGQPNKRQILCTVGLDPGIHRRQSEWLGGSGPSPKDTGPVVRKTVGSFHKCAGAHGHLEGTTESSECSTGKADPHLFRQCHGSVIHKQARRHQECRSDEGHVSDFCLGRKKRPGTVSSVHPRETERTGRLSKSAQGSIRGVGLASGGVPVASRQVGTPGSRPDGIKSQQESPRVLRKNKRSTGSGSGRPNNALGLQVRLPVSPHINDPQGPSEGQAGGSTSHSSGSSMATKSMVSGDSSGGSRSRFSVAPTKESADPGTVLASKSEPAEFNGMTFESSLWRARGFSVGVVGTLLNARKPVSARIYHRIWHGYIKWCDALVNKILLDKHGHNLTPELKDIQEKHKEHLLERTQNLVEHRPPRSTQEQQSFYLTERYVNMIVVSTDHFRQRSQHELIETGKKHEDILKKERFLLEHIALNKLFRWSCQNHCVPNVVMVSGVPGIGKTTLMQKFVYDWVTGKLYQRFSFLFFFKFRELNRLDKVSLESMILQQYPYLQGQLQNILQDPQKLLFIFDGLDESNHQIDFTSDQLCHNTQWTESCMLNVVSLLRQSLLKGCSVLMTSRPTKLASIGINIFQRVSEIMGFSPKEIQMYFECFFQNKDLSEKAFHYVRENDTLYTFCYIPSYCWIICTVLSMCFKAQPTTTDQLMSSLPKTLTQLFVTFVSNILSNHSQDIRGARELMTSIGWMAEHGVMNHLIVFDERDLGSFNVDTSSHLTSGFLMESDQSPNVTFSFLHLTLQEFLAALVHYLDYSEKLQSSLNNAKSYTDGRAEIFLRFLCGFMDSSTRSLLKCLGDFSIKALKDVTSWLQKSLADVHKDRNINIVEFLNIFVYLFESQNRTLVEECLGSNKTFTLSNISLTPIDCTVLAFVLKSCRETETLAVHKCDIQSEGWKRLAPVLHTIRHISLSYNDLTDRSCTQLAHGISNNQSLRTLDLYGNNLEGPHFCELGTALSSPTCRIEELRLRYNKLTDRSCTQLASGIRNNRSVRKLDLSNNKLGGPHFCDLGTALSSPTCWIEELLLSNNYLTDRSCNQLAPGISNNQSLRKLDLSRNNLDGPHFCELVTALSSPTCRIEELLLSNNYLTDRSCTQLAPGISNNQSLRKLDLSGNNLGGSHFCDLVTALSSPTCRIEELRLSYNDLTDRSCTQLAPGISNNQSLRTLNLSGNNLEGPHFCDLATALSSPTCRIEELLLSNNYLTDRSCNQLASDISNNQSLRKLDLSGNNLEGPHFCELVTALSSPTCRIEELLLSSNDLTDRSFTQLAPGISNNQSLRALDLSGNNLEGPHFCDLVTALSSSTCRIEKLLLRNTWLTDKEAPLLVSLSNNTNLTHLDLSHNGFQDHGYNLISELIQRSTSLKEIRTYPWNKCTNSQQEEYHSEGTPTIGPSGTIHRTKNRSTKNQRRGTSPDNGSK